jgi:hypothetical protein
MVLTTMRSRLRRFDELVGFRGSVLLFLALWAGGQSARLAWPDPAVLGTPTYVYLASIAPLKVLALPWGVCSILCAVEAFRKVDWLSFSATAGVLVAWAFIYLAGGIQGAIPQAYWSCIVQIAVAGLILRLSRLQEPDRRRP